MKKIISLIFLINTTLLAQDYINITFRHYPIGPNVVRAFVPGTFNNWGPNSSGRIAVNAPSQMIYIDSLGFFVKTIRLRDGDTHNYKFHEHLNADGSSWQWYTDPLNPLINYSDNDNSILNVTKIMIFDIHPKDGTAFLESPKKVVAGVFSRENDPILFDQSTIYLDDSLLTTFEGNVISDLSILSYQLPALNNGEHKIVINVLTQNGESRTDSIKFQVISPIIQPLPVGIVDGINYINDSTVTLSFFVHHKKFIHVIGDFNDWKVDPAYLMRQTPDRSRFWLTITGLKPHQEYLYQYQVDGNKRIADPYCEKVADPWNDQYISNQTYPDLAPYPTGKTTEIASVLKIGEQPYQWEIDNFKRPEQKDLLIYELLIRDFIKEHNYNTLIDTLGYFERFGINAIELMPINEFEGNNSWGYNPSFYFAPDKYYGPKDDLKHFIDECHKRGIAVILDIVLNHSFGQSPLVRLFSDGNYGPPSSNNPWYNVTATHPYSVGYDFNHESFLTKLFVDSVTTYWLKEYKVDGYRFDLSKGFTQKYCGNDVGMWSSYDASRCVILKRIANRIWSIDSTAYVILEHFAENREEQELAECDMLLWNNLNSAYSQSAMGWLEDSQRSSDLSWGYFGTRGWSKPGLVTYMESHDEPWLMYKNLQYGRSSGDYNIKNITTALDRIKLVAAFFFTLPGPKMIWQFGELGYDQYLPESGPERCDPKPILWEYYQQPARQSLYETYAALIKLRNENELFRDPGAIVKMRVGQGQYDRRINISNGNMSATIIGNFGVAIRDVNPNFQKTGKWYNYFSGDSLLVTDTQNPISLFPGEYQIFTDKKLETPNISTNINENITALPTSFVLEQNFPNPFNSSTTIRYSLTELNPTQTIVTITNILGQEVKILVNEKQTAGTYQILWDGLDDSGKPVSSGVYLYLIISGKSHAVKKLVFIK
jgi:1,4-alpha-glucan branching enzyme